MTKYNKDLLNCNFLYVQEYNQTHTSLCTYPDIIFFLIKNQEIIITDYDCLGIYYYLGAEIL